MKKLICIVSAAIIMSFAFAGCGNNDDNNLATDAANAASDIVSQVETMADDMATGGSVTDSDGIIGNEGSESGNNNNSASEAKSESSASAAN